MPRDSSWGIFIYRAIIIFACKANRTSMKSIFLFVITISVFIFSCTKDEDIIAPEPSLPPVTDTTTVPPSPPVTPIPTDSAESLIGIGRTGIYPDAMNEVTCYNPDLSVRWKRTGIGNGKGKLVYANNIFYFTTTYFKLNPAFPQGQESYGICYAFNAQTGSTVWSLINTGTTPDFPSVRNDTFFCSGQRLINNVNSNHILAKDARTGTAIWEYAMPDKYGPINMTLNGNILYYYSIADDNIYVWLNAFDVNTRSLKWRKSTGVSLAISVSQPLIVNGMIYMSSSSTGTVKAFDAASGDPVWQRVGTFNQPLYCGGRIFSRDEDNVFHGFNKNTGVTEITFPTGFHSGYSIGATEGNHIFISGNYYENNIPKAKIASFNTLTGTANWVTPNSSKWRGDPFTIGKYVYEVRGWNSLYPNDPTVIARYNSVTGVIKDSIILGLNRENDQLAGVNKNDQLIKTGN